MLTCRHKFNSDMIHSITTGIEINIGDLLGSPVDWEYNPEILGIPQIDNIDQETLLLFTSHTDKSCLRDLLSCKCFVGEAEVLVQNRLGI